MESLGQLLRKLRGKESLRDAANRAGISHNYLSIIEKGSDPRSGAPAKPSPDTLKALAKAYGVSYLELMHAAGYVDEALTSSDGNYNDAQTTLHLIEKEAEKLGLTIDDPVFNKMLSDAFELLRIARGKDTN